MFSRLSKEGPLAVMSAGTRSGEGGVSSATLPSWLRRRRSTHRRCGDV